MIEIERMTLADLDGVYAIEQESFAIPWTRQSIIQELTENKLAIYIVAREVSAQRKQIVGYAGLWHVVTEGHITNIAVAPDFRRKGVGGALLEALIAIAKKKEMIGVTLEVRMGNEGAMRLYARYGFRPEGLRKNYYADTKEDAVIMWKYL